MPAPTVGDGRRATTTASISTRLAEPRGGTPAPALLYVLPTFHNPTGRTLDAGAAAGARRGRGRARPAGVRGRPVRPAADRGRGAAVASRRCCARPAARTSRIFAVVVLEDASRRGCGSATWCCRSTSSASAHGGRRRAPTCRRRCCRRRSCTRSSRPGYLEPHLDDLAAFLRPRRDALLEALAGLPDGAAVDAPRRRLLPVARAARAPRRRRAQRAARARGRRDVRAGRRVLRRRAAPVERAAALQLSVRRRDPRRAPAAWSS